MPWLTLPLFSHPAPGKKIKTQALRHENVVGLDSVHMARADASLWLAFDYADHDLYDMVRFHREARDARGTNTYGGYGLQP